MALSHKEVINRALDKLVEGMSAFVAREMKRKGERFEPTKDPHELLKTLAQYWPPVFSDVLGPLERSCMFELKEYRNRVAHNEAVSGDDAERVLDSAYRLLAAVGASETAQDVYEERQKLVDLRQSDRVRQRAKRVAAQATIGEPTGGLKPWREIISPHPDVASGKYQQAEFAADLWQVYQGIGSDEYRDARAFFERTYITESLHKLLTEALRRMAGQGGTPVFKLETNFGGGKTHCLLALFHLFSGTPAAKLLGVEKLMKECQVKELPQVHRAVIVGTMGLTPGQPNEKKDGTVVRTLWGEIAYQLGGKKGYALVKQADETGTNPGDALRKLFHEYAPCLILIDEWIAYARQLKDEAGLPGGTFDAQMTFAQTITEAAKASPQTLLVFSLPVSKYEIGGLRADAAHEHIKNVLARVDSPLRPAGMEESFEIVRRRLFQELQNPDARDTVVRAFSDMYRNNKREFPSECGEKAYMDRMEHCYPIHPELFGRIYGDWAVLEKFQHTRGVLRLMAKIIQVLWESSDANLLIMPGMVPLADEQVQAELCRYLEMETQWQSIINGDIDGPGSLPLRLDSDHTIFGRYAACRRVARTLFLRSAPNPRSASRGLEDRQVRLGSVQPGEAIATFGDALKRLADRATYLYVDGQRYWYGTQPTVNRLAQDRAEQVGPDAILQEIAARLANEQRARTEFTRVHACPVSGSDVPDEMETRLVIIGPEHTFTAKDMESPAVKHSRTILDSRGASPRKYRNTLVFLAADSKRLEELSEAVRSYHAWKSIYAERGKDGLNLDDYQETQAKAKRDEADSTVERRIGETYCWALVPEQKLGEAEVTWTSIRLQANGSLAQRTAKKLIQEEQLIIALGGTLLRKALDDVPLWRDANHVSVKQLQDDFATYLYLPRVKGPEVLVNAVNSGLELLTWRDETFAYAEGYDEASGKYGGIHRGQALDGGLISTGLLVKPEAVPEPEPSGGDGPKPDDKDKEKGKTPTPGPVEKRFHGTVELNPLRWAKDAQKVYEEVVTHLKDTEGAALTMTLEIQAKLPKGVTEETRRTVDENCNTLKFKTHGFEEDA